MLDSRTATRVAVFFLSGEFDKGNALWYTSIYEQVFIY